MAEAVRQEIAQRDHSELHPVILEFKELIERDPVVRLDMTSMIDQIPARYRHHHPKNVDELLAELNAVLTVAPAYVPPGHGEETALVGTPFSAILIWTMGTDAGFAAYRNPKINEMFRKLLAVWTDFLDSEDSAYVLNPSPSGWMSPEAQAQLQMGYYDYDPDAPHWGFTSWNQFFTRSLKDGARPIQLPDDDSAIVSACDSTVYRIAQGDEVKRQAKFWIKSQPYSVADMLNHEFVDHFVGGSVFQAFLSPFNYHRWHSPVSGTIKKAFVQPGLYFSQAPSEGEDPTDQDHSEGYITSVQARALIFIEADNPAIGLVCVMPVGMVEISSCILADGIEEGAHVDKGQELGYFQFGGSTHCVFFGRDVIREFTGGENSVYQVGQVIAFANG
jgi:phosphatidylserine decarboxylase